MVRREKKWGSQTECRYFNQVLKGRGKFESEQIIFTPPYLQGRNEHHYTPDFVTEIAVRPIAPSLQAHCEDVERGAEMSRKVYHEVKGSYRLGSQDAARLRWCMAAVSRPDAVFVWAKERKDKRWDVEVWWDGGRTQAKQMGVWGFRFTHAGGVEWVK